MQEAYLVAGDHGATWEGRLRVAAVAQPLARFQMRQTMRFVPIVDLTMGRVKLTRKRMGDTCVLREA